MAETTALGEEGRGGKPPKAGKAEGVQTEGWLFRLGGSFLPKQGHDINVEGREADPSHCTTV